MIGFVREGEIASVSCCHPSDNQTSFNVEFSSNQKLCFHRVLLVKAYCVPPSDPSDVLF